MSASLTIELDADVLRAAEQQAQAHHTSVRDIVGQQLLVMAQNWRQSQIGKTPVTDSLRGAVRLPEGFDEKGAVVEALAAKYGAA